VLDNGNVTGWAQFAFGVMPLILLIVLWTAVAIMSLVFVCERFYKGLLGDEGYLSMTLPVTTEAHIASKAITALLLELITGIAALVSGLLLIAVYKPAILSEIFRALPKVFDYIDGRVITLLIEYLVFILVGSVAKTMHIYLAICLGHLAKNHRVAWSVGAYILISVVISNILTLCAPLLNRIPEEWFFTIDELGTHMTVFAPLAWLIAGAILVEAVVAAVYFFASNYILKNRLNLE
jgi:hypothetical protein